MLGVVQGKLVAALLYVDDAVLFTKNEKGGSLGVLSMCKIVQGVLSGG